MANSEKMSGGSNVALLTLEFSAIDRENGHPMQVSTPSLFFAADIKQDMLLSERWMAERGIDVCPRRHVLQGVAQTCIVWIPGARAWGDN